MASSDAPPQQIQAELMTLSASHAVKSTITKAANTHTRRDSTDDNLSHDLGAIVNPSIGDALSPVVSRTTVDSKTQLEEAITRSLADQMPYIGSIFDHTNDVGETSSSLQENMQQKQVLTDVGTLEIVTWKGKTSNNNAENGLGKKNGDIIFSTTTEDGVSQQAQLHPPLMGQLLDKNNDRDAPDSSVLALVGKNQMPLRDGIGNHKRNGSQDVEVTRTLDADRDIMVVSAIPRKRKGRKNQSSYYDITSELRYLR